MPEQRLKIAVFIDFDNIEIGVKNTLNAQFDIGIVLEALKERGDVVSKTAYGDWTRAGDYSRSLTQHATKLVQRNLTPGGDKNGADINLALDALEMAFTHSHINAYVIVGGDSDFITLVEKLKQYDKQIFVVGGRAFTSLVMQRNCHEFIAYENLVGPRRPADRGRQSGPVASQAPIEQVVPLVRRALKVLPDREVSPQLGLLKSTLLQLDSTFSERDYGASTFRDFIEKMAAAGYVKLKQVDRSLLVELKEQAHGQSEEPEREIAAASGNGQSVEHSHAAPAAPTPVQAEEGVRAMQEAFQRSPITPHWPMYLRNVKQFIKNSAPAFDEHRYGFHSFLDAVRHAQRAGLLRLERNRQGILRVFPGALLSKLERAPMPPVEEPAAAERAAVPYDVEEQMPSVEPEPQPMITPTEEPIQTQPESTEFNLTSPAALEESPPRKRRTSSGIKRKTGVPRKSARPAGKRTKKKTSAPQEQG